MPTARNEFAVFRQIDTRWMDVDIYGHVNNVQYLSFFDTAVNSWYVEKGLIDPARSNNIFLVVETGCHYFAELKFPETIDAGIRSLKIGSSSVIYEIALFKENETEAAAQGRFVHVLVDRETRRPIRIPDDIRKVLEELGAPA
ncbi:thioesterase family protein [Roseibium sp.]|uniref:acyl-CoA thioesterase n=1 Tax=Roseibium sp. TaxID=1936156 RepID=UPI003266BA2C